MLEASNKKAPGFSLGFQSVHLCVLKVRRKG